MSLPVYFVGDAVVDFLPHGDNGYLKCAGGAPANSAVGVAKLGGNSLFIGKVGDDPLGKFLNKELIGYGVNTRHMSFSEQHRTGLVLVDLDDNGERSFTFMVRPSADQALSESDLPVSYEDNAIVHFVSIAFANEPVRTTSFAAIEKAKQQGALISFDPNIRPTVWQNEEEIKPVLLKILPDVDILKVSEEELEYITGESDLQKGLDALAKYNIDMVVVTFGSEGSYSWVNGQLQHVPTLKVETVDTTGAGDAFVSGMLYQVAEQNKALTSFAQEELATMLRFANICGAKAASAKGAMTALPSLAEVNDIL